MTEAKQYEITRSAMTVGELKSHHVGARGRDYRVSDDGYSDMAAEARHGWKLLSSWGRDGWDLGEWPYVSYMVRKHDGSRCDPICVLAGRTGTDFCPSYELLQIVEGDRDRWVFATEEELFAALDGLFLRSRAGKDAVAREPERPAGDFRGPVRFQTEEAGR